MPVLDDAEIATCPCDACNGQHFTQARTTRQLAGMMQEEVDNLNARIQSLEDIFENRRFPLSFRCPAHEKPKALICVVCAIIRCRADEEEVFRVERKSKRRTTTAHDSTDMLALVG